MDKYDRQTYERRRGQLRGLITIIEHRGGEEGDVVAYEGTNLITNAGLQWFMDRAVGNTVDPVSHIAIGDSATAPTPADTTLNSEQFRKAISDLSSPSNTLRAEMFVSSAEALFTWREIGILNASSSGVLVNHLLLEYTHGAVDVTIVLELTVADDGV